jgi:hypothetical protein
MRRAALLVLLLAACARPSGVAVEECNTSWRGLEARIAIGADDDQMPVPIACIGPVDEQRIAIGFLMPPGPDCFELAAISLAESSDAVAVTLFVSPTANVEDSCPTVGERVVTEVDLQAPVGDRALLDGSR